MRKRAGSEATVEGQRQSRLIACSRPNQRTPLAFLAAILACSSCICVFSREKLLMRSWSSSVTSCTESGDCDLLRAWPAVCWYAP